VPATVNAPELSNWIVPAPLLDVIVPAFVNVLPLTFIVMLLLLATVTLPFTAVPAEVVVVTAPPLRFNVVVPAPTDLANVSVCPAVGAIDIAPPLVTIDAFELSGAVIVRAFAPPPELTATDDALREEPAPNVSPGLLIVMLPPPPTVCVTPPGTTTDPPVACAFRFSTPAVPGVNVYPDAPRVKAFAPPTASVIVPAPAPVTDIGAVGVPASVNAPVLCIVMFPPALLDVMVPLSVNVLPFTFIVMSLLLANATFAFIVEPAEVVVVTAPPFKLRDTTLPLTADFCTVNVCPAVGAIAIVPPVVEILELKPTPSGTVIASALAPPPELTVTADAPVAAMVEPLPRNVSDGVLTVTAPPPAIVSVRPEATVTEPPVACALKLVVPLPPALNV